MNRICLIVLLFFLLSIFSLSGCIHMSLNLFKCPQWLSVVTVETTNEWISFIL